MVKAIVFDYDDTLVQTMASKWDAMRETGRRYYGLDISDEHIKKYWGRPFQEMLEGVLMHADTFENLQRSYESLHNQFPMRAYENAPQVVTKLMEKYAVGVLTASSRRLLIADLTMLGFPVNRMVYLQTSEDTDVYKPDPQVFQPMLRHLAERHIEQNEVIYVGDDLKDYEAARGAGLKFYGVTYGTTSRAAFESQGAKTISRLSDLLSIDL